MATVNNAMWVEVKASPENIKKLKGCDKIELRLVSTKGDCCDVIKTFTEKFVNKLCDE